ncbi:MAG: AMP-binding protein [Sandaracinus sp.]
MIHPPAYASLGELLSDALVQWKRETALVEMDRKKLTHAWTYRETKAEVMRVARWLASLELAPGDRVAILMSNQSRWLVAACALFRRGLVLVPIDYKLSESEQLALLAHAEPSVLVVEQPLFRRFAKAPPVAHVLVSEAPAGVSAQRWEDLPEEEDHAEDVPLVTRERGDAASIVYSSGTGGTPKGCVLTHDAYLEQLQALMDLFPMKPGHRTFSVLPTNHAIDFMVGFVGPFACGSTVVHQRTLRPEFLVSTMREQKITHIALVPVLLEAFERALDEKLDQRPAWQRAALDGLSALNLALTRDKPDAALSRRLLGGVHAAFGGHLELVFAGGAFVDRDRAERFYRLGLPVVIGYGLTECCTVATVNDLRPFRADSVGRPVRGVEVRIHEPGPDGIGEVWIRGRTVMKEYFKEPELTARTITPEGWLKTGDLGTLDASEHLRLVGRSKNMIVTAGGKNVYPEDVEGALEGSPAAELAVFASGYVWPRSRALTEEILFAVARAKPSEAAAVTRWLSERNRRLPEHKRLSAVLVVDDAFPRTASMKLKRDVLAERLRADFTERELVSIGHAPSAAEARP